MDLFAPIPDGERRVRSPVRNGVFPTLIALLSMFFVTGQGLWSSLTSAVLLMGTIVLALTTL